MASHRKTSKFLIVSSALAIGAVLLAGAPAVGAPAAKVDPLARYYAQRISWEPCGEQLECGAVAVPIDYRKPKGATITIQVNRRLTAGASAPSLLVNPGGPGASGIELIADPASAQLVLNPSSPPVQSIYNLVGFDPRGVGLSAPLECVTTAQIDAVPGTVSTTPAEWAADAALDKQLGDTCYTIARALTANMGTEMVARDLDIIRAALQSPKLNYYGISYGSYLGQMYAHLFPGHVGRMVLDSVMSPSATEVDLARSQATSFQEAFNHWAQTCSTRATCSAPAGMPAEQIPAWATGVINGLAGSPLSIGTSRPFTQQDALSFAAASMTQGGATGPMLLDYMLLAITRNVPAVLTIVQDFIATQVTPNRVSANRAVMCFDRPATGTLDDTVRLAAELSAVSPTFGASVASMPQTCFSWPVRRGKAIPTVAPVTKAPVLLIGSRHDPNTPYEWSVAASQLFARNALLTWEGWGHGTGTRGNTCINDAVGAYLVSGTLPAAGTTCVDTEVAPQ